MWLLLISLSLAAIASILLIKKFGDIGFIGLVFLLLLSICGSVFIPYAFIPELDLSTTTIKPEYATLIETRTPIVAIKDNTLVSGSVFLFGGSINEEPVYFYYKEEAGGFVLNHIRAKGLIIYEDTPENTGYILRTESRVPQWFIDKYLHWAIFSTRAGPTKLTIHIPPGSIVRQFILDAE